MIVNVVRVSVSLWKIGSLTCIFVVIFCSFGLYDG